ncbi:MAG TPA: choice-of-anchor D domain-containing protein, partial [Edaphobacter sp.]|nr:choice-of-anchor D domain-containing protein [Edaphobacter sp.]
LDFGSVALGSNVTQPIDIANTGQQALSITAISVTGTNAADFIAAPGQCPTVAAGTSCSLQISFHPSADVSESAQLSISDGAPGSPQSVSLTGKGVAPVAWAAPSSSTTATTTSGSTASYALSLASGSSFSGKVTITCTGAPQYATCTPNPSALELTTGQTASITVAVATGNASTASAGALAPLHGTTIVYVISLPLLGLWSRRSRKSIALAIGILVGCVVLGCGGSSSTTTPPVTAAAQKTTPGTYTLQVTATAASFTQTQNLTLVVQLKRGATTRLKAIG